MRQTTAVDRNDPVRRTRRVEQAFETMVAEVREGLSRRPLPELPCKYFYDERGSALFEAITELPEYYPTRTETAILEAHAAEIVRAAAPRRAGRARLGGRPQDPPVPRRDARARLARERGAARDQRGIPSRVGRSAPGRLPRGGGARHRRRLHLRPRRRSGPGAAGSCCSWPAPSATCTPTSCPRSSAARRRCSPGATASWSESTWSRTRPASTPPTTTRPGVTAEFNRNILRVLNDRLARGLRPRGLRAPGLLRRRAAVDRDAPSRAAPDGRPRPRGGDQAPPGEGRRDPHRALLQVHAGVLRRAARGHRPRARALDHRSRAPLRLASS